MEERTIKQILQELHDVVQERQIMSPDWWIDRAFELVSLWQDLKDNLSEAEMKYKSEIVALVEEGKKISEADRIVEAKSENYKLYLYLKGRDKIVSELIMLAKKRGTIDKFI